MATLRVRGRISGVRVYDDAGSMVVEISGDLLAEHIGVGGGGAMLSTGAAGSVGVSGGRDYGPGGSSTTREIGGRRYTSSDSGRTWVRADDPPPGYCGPWPR